MFTNNRIVSIKVLVHAFFQHIACRSRGCIQKQKMHAESEGAHAEAEGAKAEGACLPRGARRRKKSGKLGHAPTPLTKLM